MKVGPLHLLGQILPEVQVRFLLLTPCVSVPHTLHTQRPEPIGCAREAGPRLPLASTRDR